MRNIFTRSAVAALMSMLLIGAAPAIEASAVPTSPDLVQIEVAESCQANDNLFQIADTFISKCRKASIRREFPAQLQSSTLRVIKDGRTAIHRKAWKLLNDRRFMK